MICRNMISCAGPKLQTRFERTAQNIQAVLRFADVGLLIDNSSAEAPDRLVELWEYGERTEGADSIP